MNEWLMVAIAVVGTLVIAGGGGWILNALKGNRSTPPKA